MTTIDEIRNGRKPLSIALGFEEETISRYLKGQVPSKENSDVLATYLPQY
ncbi:MAG: hypothetical protein K5639_04860 [Eubacterium sp.]|nr:hypothetical protein [Eubacterium sp.]